MMRILTRYIFREYLVPLGYCLGGFLSIYVLFELFGSFSRLVEAKLPFKLTVHYFCAYLSPFFEYLAPAALMLAALYTMWSFCRHSEIIAMRASGISLWVIVKPILAVALGMAIFVWWVNDSYVPAYAQWARQMKTEKFILAEVEKSEMTCYRDPDSQRTWEIMKLEKGSPEHLLGVSVVVNRPNSSARLFKVTADRADYLDGEWWFTNPKVQHYDEHSVECASPTKELDELQFRTFPDFVEQPVDFVMLNRDWAYNSIADRFRYLRTHPALSPDTRRKYVYDTWAKIFSPLACLVITLFAIPAGIASGRQSVFRGILGALGLFFGFYAVMILGMILAQMGYFPPILAALLPHLLFFLWGLRWFLRQR